MSMDLATGLVDRYRSGDGVIAGLVLGSIARGFADERSDVDLAIVWDERIDVDWLETPVLGAVGGHRFTWSHDPASALEQYELGGRKVDVGHWPRSTSERVVASVVEELNTRPAALLQVGGLVDAVAVFGAAVLDVLRAPALVYPPALRRAVIESAPARLAPSLASVALARGDLVAYYDVLLRGVKRSVTILAAVNGIYFGMVPDWKWVPRRVGAMALRPPDAARLLDVMFGPPSATAIDALRTFLDEAERLGAAVIDGSYPR